MVESDRASMCPLMRRLIAMVARASQLPGLQERGWLIDQLTHLEADGVAAAVPARTLDAIRAMRLKIRIESLMPRPVLSNGPRTVRA